MRYCETCGLRYPDSIEKCRACRNQLVPVSAAHLSRSGDSSRLAVSCCPKPSCDTLVAPAQTKFCALCGSALQPISHELWLDKFVKPALQSSPAEVLLNPLDLFHPVAEMGLSGREARERFDALVEELTGAEPKLLDSWIQEVMDLLEVDQKPGDAQREALRRAGKLNINLQYATAVIDDLTQRVKTSAAASVPQPWVPAPLTEASSENLDQSAAARGGKISKAVGAIPSEDSLRTSAISFYRNMASGGSVSNNLTYLTPEKESSALGLLAEDNVFLREVAHKQGTFVLFRGSNKQGWVFPNPRLIFQPKALTRLFPSLTREQFNKSKIYIEPVRAIGAGKRRWQVSPLENGLRAAQTGNVTTTAHKESEISRPVDEFPVSANDYLGRVPDAAQIVRHDIAMDKLVVGPNGKGELVLIRDPRALDNTESLFVLPRIARFWSTDAFYYFYEKYYDCAKPSVGDMWIINPAVVSRVQGGWKLKKKGVMEVRNDGKANNHEEGPSSNDPSDSVTRFTGHEEQGHVEVVAPSLASHLLKRLTLVLAFVGILALAAFWVVNRSTDRSPANANSGTVTPPSPSPSMALVPGGEFTMGNDSGDKYEKPAHKASVTPFLIDINEVTCDDYAKFIKATGHKAPVGWIRGDYPSGLARRPVTGFFWDEDKA
jgi:hypothetical protein